MKSKSLLIAVAAFAVTATGVHAFSNPAILTKAGLSDEQVVAFQEAHELKTLGKFDDARTILIEAGVTKDTIRTIHDVAREAKMAVRNAVEANDYEAFQIAIADSPLADIITAEVDFDSFREAFLLRQDGEYEAAHDILEELGVPDRQYSGFVHKGGHKLNLQGQLSDEQRDALQVAKQANDHDSVKAILEEVGVELRHYGRGRKQ